VGEALAAAMRGRIGTGLSERLNDVRPVVAADGIGFQQSGAGDRLAGVEAVEEIIDKVLAVATFRAIRREYDALATRAVVDDAIRTREWCAVQPCLMEGRLVDRSRRNRQAVAF